MIVPRLAFNLPRHLGSPSTRRPLRLKALIVLWAAILGMVTPASANEAQWHLCKAARALGSASARAHIFGEVFGTEIPAEQFAAIIDHMTAAAIHITAAEALFEEPFATERQRKGTAEKVLRLIETYLADFATMSARNRVFYIEQIFSVYSQGLMYTFVSSRPDAFQWNPNCDTKILRVCFFYGKASIAAASIGTPGRPDFVDSYQIGANGHIFLAVKEGLEIAMDREGHRPFNGHAKKICCTFGTPAEWAAMPDFGYSPGSVYAAFEPIMLEIISSAALLDPVCYGDDVCASSNARTPFTSEMEATDLRVYEGPRDPPGFGQRTYETRFDQATARYINFEVHFAHAQPGRRVDFAIDYRIYGGDGLFAQGTLNSHLEADWYTSHHSVGWGWAESGNWPAGQYRVEMSINGRTIADGLFEIFDSGGVVPPPIPRSECPATAPSPNWDLETGPGVITRWYWNASLGMYCGYLYGGTELNQYRLEPGGNGYYLVLWNPADGSYTRGMRMDRGDTPDPSTGWAEAGSLSALQADGTWKEISWWFGRVP